MDDRDRAELRAANTDVTAIASVAIQGVVGICAELLWAGTLSTRQVGRISDFMLASLEGSGATPRMQAHLHEAIGHQFSSLVAGYRPPDTAPPTREG